MIILVVNADGKSEVLDQEWDDQHYILEQNLVEVIPLRNTVFNTDCLVKTKQNHLKTFLSILAIHSKKMCENHL